MAAPALRADDHQQGACSWVRDGGRVRGSLPTASPRPMLDQQFWQSYTDRQPRTDAAHHLRALLSPWLSDIHSVLEVGCNRGDNLDAFDCEVTGVEPNQYARDIARERWHVIDAVAHNLPFPDGSFDLAYTVGVLIHVPPWQLGDSLSEIHRVSSRYVLAVEYEAPKPVPVDYRGVRAGIWKRPYGA